MPRDRFVAGLSALGGRYEIVTDESMFSKNGYFAGDDNRRADELNRYIRNPDVRAILCARGGYGLTRILDRLDVSALRGDPKPVVGFSDATALLSLCIDAHVRPIHGPVVCQLGDLPLGDVAHLIRMLEDPAPLGRFPEALTRCGGLGGGSVEGPLVGGNLEVLSRLLGTPWAVDLGAAIFFVEDVGERPYRIDRLWTHLRTAGALDAARAVLLGDFVRCVEPGGEPPTVEEVLEERLRTFDLPALSGLPVGHGARNMALPWGARAVVDLARSELFIEEGAVS